MSLFPAGSAPTASQMTPILARKTVDQSIASSTTMTNDTALSASVLASATYDVAVHLVYTAAAAQLIQIGFSGPSGATLDWVVQGLGATVTAADQGIFTALARGIADTKILGCDGTTPVAARVTGLLVVSTTPGTLHFQWSQSVSGTTATVVKSGSYMTLRRVA